MIEYSVSVWLLSPTIKRLLSYYMYIYIIQIRNGYECNGTDIFMR